MKRKSVLFLCLIYLLHVPIFLGQTAFALNSSIDSLLEKDKFRFDGDSLYLRSKNTISNFGANFDFSFGYRVGGVYELGSNKSIAVQWVHYAEDGEIPPELDASSDFTISITGTQQEQLEVLNVSFVQEIDFTNQFVMVLFGGAQYVDYSRRFEVTGRSSQFTMLSTFQSSFDGIGPRVGIGIDYHVKKNLIYNVEASYASLILRTGHTTQTNDITSAMFNTFEDIESDEKGPLGGFEGQMMLTYHIRRAEGTLSIRGGLLGVSYSERDTQYEGVFFGATWTSNH